LDTMLQWLHEAMRALPSSRYANLLLFCTLTGMRGSECIEAVRLICKSTDKYYYNPERQILQHYLFPEIFIRRTKAINISIINDDIIGLAEKIGNTHLNGLKKAIRHSCLSMKIKYCRKIYVSWLRHFGIEPEIINMLQGRIGKDIFLRHYYSPSLSYREKVLDAVVELQKEINATNT
jgi:intergrase/recombinase